MPKTFRSNFSFGGVMAESDPLLPAAYWDNGDYEAIASQSDPRCFVIGRTGSGKSAAFQHLEERYTGQVIRILPEDLSLPYIVNLDVIRQLRALDVHIEPFLIALWKHILIVEILRFRYRINSPDEKQNVLTTLRQLVARDTRRMKAIDYLNEFGDKFWSETDERVKQVTETFERKINSAADVHANASVIGAKGSASLDHQIKREIRQDIASRYQKVVDNTQLARLNDMIMLLDGSILRDHEPYLYLLIDDLDKDWVSSDVSNLLIRCLFRAVIDMKRVKRLKILVALRTNIFQELDYAAEGSGGQEEKVRGLALHMRWMRNDLKSLLESRAQAASQTYRMQPPMILADMLPKSTRGDGHPVDYVLDRTLMRPRDAITFMNEAVRLASGHNRITWTMLRLAEKTFSDERLLALRDEWKSSYRDIDKVLLQFRDKPVTMTKAELGAVLDDVAMLIGDPAFKGRAWMEPMFSRLWAPGGQERTWEEIYGPIVDLLYNVSFLGIAAGPHAKPRYSYEGMAPQRATAEVMETTVFKIHPMFARGLELTDVGRRPRERDQSNAREIPTKAIQPRLALAPVRPATSD